MKMAFRVLSVLLVLQPTIAAAATNSQSTAYKLGWQVGRAVAVYGPYVGAAALIGVVAFLWYRRKQSRALQR